MAIIWADFPSGQLGLYGSNIANILNGIWAGYQESTSITTDPDPNIGASGHVLLTNTSTSGFTASQASIALPSTQDTVGLGVRLWLSRLPNATDERSRPFIQFRTGANAAICSIAVAPNGAIVATSGTHAGAVLGTSQPSVVANGWQHIEAKVVRHASAGTIEVRVDGVAKLSLTGLALGASSVGILALNIGQIFNGVDINAYWKDLAIWDSTGTECNDFQGSVAVYDLYTDADISLNWTPSTGTTGWDLIDETTPNDADYISAPDPAPAAAVFSLTDLPEDVTSVRALLPIYRAMKTDGGDCNVQVGLTPDNVAWDDGSDRPLTTSFTYWWDVSHLSPDTAAPWTPIEVNDAYVRVDRTL